MQKRSKFHIMDLFVMRDKLVLIRQPMATITNIDPPGKLILFIIHHAILSSVNKTPHNSFRFYKNNLIAFFISCINVIYSCDSLN